MVFPFWINNYSILGSVLISLIFQLYRFSLITWLIERLKNERRILRVGVMEKEKKKKKIRESKRKREGKRGKSFKRPIESSTRMIFFAIEQPSSRCYSRCANEGATGKVKNESKEERKRKRWGWKSEREGVEGGGGRGGGCRATIVHSTRMKNARLRRRCATTLNRIYSQSVLCVFFKSTYTNANHNEDPVVYVRVHLYLVPPPPSPLSFFFYFLFSFFFCTRRYVYERYKIDLLNNCILS